MPLCRDPAQQTPATILDDAQLSRKSKFGSHFDAKYGFASPGHCPIDNYFNNFVENRFRLGYSRSQAVFGGGHKRNRKTRG